ncbi:pyridoxamine 5'-phosphate oxidase [Thecamonas trahens ATCC 50062]|uniref:pyridoxal 5'-phosphate synthase n=1 Tax=Thecamonas trahens ATCC 50062 TaxID=461836 RepID=A0A0L0DTP2_THETB|nr:pyridoxamine 5'-phosphate oxidase [Thecamonas trahens ATCC 50062]KNC55431.1 pyridoxamine 5'-phosphate oxidase [Thecamonas trahens ATCC 50062]|eukprot:XP_013752968.1 pyridoxamine 5'-phosphate oxidase [Thecamonas trahens ATCC 50062]
MSAAISVKSRFGSNAEATHPPIVHFTRYYAHARDRSQRSSERQFPGVHNALLSTVSPDGFPDARTVSLHEYSDDGFVFCTARGSPKARQLLASGTAALTFLWPPSQSQVRIMGRVTEQSREATLALFDACTPREQAYYVRTGSGGQFGQSQVVAVVEDCHDAQQAVDDAGPEYALPDGWTSFILLPHVVEFLCLAQASRMRYIHVERCRESGPVHVLHTLPLEAGGEEEADAGEGEGELARGGRDAGHGWYRQDLAM